VSARECTIQYIVGVRPPVTRDLVSAFLLKFTIFLSVVILLVLVLSYNSADIIEL
jgi:hypothetical protein